MTKIARRKFIQLSAATAAGCFIADSRDARAQDLPQITEDDPQGKAYQYTHDASSVDASSRPRPEADQTCDNCQLIQGNDGDEWRPCQILPGKLVKADGWCMVWSPKT